MSTSPIQLPPLITPIVDPKSGMASIAFAMWQQQLLQSRSPWTAYLPTTAHMSAITINDCAYVQAGKRVSVRIGIQGTTDGTAFTVTLPFKAKTQNQTFAVAFAPNLAGVATVGGDLLTLTVNKYDGTTPINGTVVQWAIEGTYEAQ